MTVGDRPPLLVFADDWGRHPSSCQHLVSHMLERRQVIWANTIGTRPPRLDRETLRRVVDRLSAWTRPAERSDQEPPTGGAEPRVINLKMWPSFERPALRTLNRELMRRQLEPVISALQDRPAVLTTLPITADLVGSIDARSWTYYCVDDFGSWPGYYGKTLAAMEMDLLRRVDLVVAASERLAESRGSRTHCPVLTHGVDIDGWRSPVDKATPVEFAHLEPPFVLFWGLIDQRMDVAWLSALAQSLSRGTVVLVGPQDAPDKTLSQIPRVTLLPAVPHARLKLLAAHADALVMPYRDMEATRAMQPLKLKEYLATGKPVVVRALPATLEWQDACHVCADKSEFVQAVIASIGTPLSKSQLIARERLNNEGWAAKADALESMIDSIELANLKEREALRENQPRAPASRFAQQGKP